MRILSINAIQFTTFQSFENPNYSALVDPALIDDHLNSNLQPSVYEELKHELDKFELSTSPPISAAGAASTSSSKRKEYAAMDVSAMGVDVVEGPTTTLDNKIKEEKMRESVDELDKYIRYAAIVDHLTLLSIVTTIVTAQNYAGITQERILFII